MKSNRELYIDATNIIGKEAMELKQRQFLLRLINKHTNNNHKPKIDDFPGTCQIIINHLNHITGKAFRSNTAETKALVRARLNDGFTIDDFKKVVNIKAKQWLNGENYIYLRPKTLFGTKFEGYLQEAIAEKPKQSPSMRGNIGGGSSAEYKPPEPTPEEIAKAKKWREEGEKLIAVHTKQDWNEFYTGMRLFKNEAYTMGLKHNLVRGLFIEFLTKKYKQ